jgi:hypothetical protein
MVVTSNLILPPHVLPTGKSDLDRFEQLVLMHIPFTYVRFSDGEIELLRNRKLSIDGGVTEFRGRRFANQFPDFDQKYFDPRSDQAIRRDLMASAVFRGNTYFKGIPTSHNNAIIDREFMLRLNGGFTQQITFSDLFMNSNFLRARSTFFPFLAEFFEDILVVGNWRCKLCEYLSKGQLIKIPDNFFSLSIYESTLQEVMTELLDAPKSALVLSSASSLSNIIGHRLYCHRSDITFLDIGTALHDLMGLPLGTRAYHKLINNHTPRDKFHAWRYRQHKEYQLKW